MEACLRRLVVLAFVTALTTVSSSENVVRWGQELSGAGGSPGLVALVPLTSGGKDVCADFNRHQTAWNSALRGSVAARFVSAASVTSCPEDLRRSLHKPPPAKLEQPVLLEHGVVRRLLPAKPEAARREIDAWQRGRQVYQPLCARCHGNDGKDAGYPGTKSLAGIGNHADEQRILELTIGTGAVNLFSLPEESRQALAVFVRGL